MIVAALFSNVHVCASEKKEKKITLKYVLRDAAVDAAMAGCSFAGVQYCVFGDMSSEGRIPMGLLCSVLTVLFAWHTTKHIRKYHSLQNSKTLEEVEFPVT